MLKYRNLIMLFIVGVLVLTGILYWFRHEEPVIPDPTPRVITIVITAQPPEEATKIQVPNVCFEGEVLGGRCNPPHEQTKWQCGALIWNWAYDCRPKPPPHCDFIVKEFSEETGGQSSKCRIGGGFFPS